MQPAASNFVSMRIQLLHQELWGLLENKQHYEDQQTQRAGWGRKLCGGSKQG